MYRTTTKVVILARIQRKTVSWNWYESRLVNCGVAKEAYWFSEFRKIFGWLGIRSTGLWMTQILNGRDVSRFELCDIHIIHISLGHSCHVRFYRNVTYVKIKMNVIYERISWSRGLYHHSDTLLQYSSILLKYNNNTSTITLGPSVITIVQI